MDEIKYDAPRRAGRPRVRSVKPDSADGERSSKRRKYVPGGPGGGGRWRDPEGDETPMSAPHSYAGTRGRSGRERGTNGVAATPTSSTRPRRERQSTQARSSVAPTAAAAVAQGDGYKPREERGWEEFHPDLDVDAPLRLYDASEVDGLRSRSIPLATLGLHVQQSITNGASQAAGDAGPEFKARSGSGSFGSSPPSQNNVMAFSNAQLTTPMRRRPGRPYKRPESMLSGLGSPMAARIVPLPMHNPRERLNLPKPSFRRVETFAQYEQDRAVQVNYVDRTMASVGYQESDMFIHPERKLIREGEGAIEEDLDVQLNLQPLEESAPTLGVISRVEYDMDEQDERWLDMHNSYRKEEQVEAIKPAIFEITMTQIEKEWHAIEKRIPKPSPKPPQTHRPRSSSAAAVNGEPVPGEEQDTKCSVCDDGDCENTNAIVFCDGCDLAVHQECYGVPYIPEGQWLCRKCQLLGRGTPTCIFCPNVDGAFKQTNNSKWSHLLCAIWIPEVSLGNMSLMEPVMDVERVPKQRWRLTCYICQQRMGACIQCGNKNCFTAFHVTCARRAKLFLRMKSSHSGPSMLDASVLKAFCDRHVPPDWRLEHDVDGATTGAKQFYQVTMRGRRWGDSQLQALSSSSDVVPYEPIEHGHPLDDSFGLSTSPGVKRKQPKVPANLWRLPSGAPVVPQIVLTSVENSLQRFVIRRKKEFLAEACKYWTLKREAKRGAALLKRLQLQLDSFSSMEITRRNFAGMGAAGGPKLQRRIEFAEQLQRDLEHVVRLCEVVKEREQEKLRDAEMLRELVDTIYFPVCPLLRPILDKAQKLDPKGVFAAGFGDIRSKFETRQYISVSAFSMDLGTIFKEAIGLSSVSNDTVEVHRQLIDRVAEQNGELTAEQKETKKLARRIIRAIQGLLEEAAKAEEELSGRDYGREIRDLEAMLECGGPHQDGRDSVTGSVVNEDMEMQDAITNEPPLTGKTPPNGIPSPAEDDGPNEAGLPPTTAPSSDTNIVTQPLIPSQPAPDQLPPAGRDPLTPSPSHRSLDMLNPLAKGGVPWYLEPFDIVGTTVHEERWTGRDVMRGMSEELSEMDEDEFKEISVVEEGKGKEGERAVVGLQRSGGAAVGGDALGQGADLEVGKGRAKAKAKKKRARRYR